MHRFNGDDFFDKWHQDGDHAFGILCEGCEVPPSFEVFQHGLERERSRGALVHVSQYARRLSDSYQRIE